jgi:hypothetical protein
MNDEDDEVDDVLRAPRKAGHGVNNGCVKRTNEEKMFLSFNSILVALLNSQCISLFLSLFPHLF